MKDITTKVAFAHHDKLLRSCLSFVEEYLEVAEELELEVASNN